MSMTSVVDVFKLLPKPVRDAGQWILVLVLLFVGAVSLNAAMVDRAEFNALAENVDHNTQAILGMRHENRISLCLDIASLEGDDHRICLYQNTRQVYLNRHVDPQAIRPPLDD